MLFYINYPSWINPQVIPSLPIRWYSLMYLVAFGVTYFFTINQIKKKETVIKKVHAENLFIYTILGLLIGARLFSTLLYENSSFYWTHPHLIFWPFRNGRLVGLPGMSYHGGLVGAVVGGLIFAKKYKYNFFDLSDTLIVGIPLGYTFGRLGNFINGELWGRVSTKSWAMVFPNAPDFSTNYSWVREVAEKINMSFIENSYINLPRHPSQLYEALGEGILLFLIIWIFIKPHRNKFKGLITGSYIIGYGAIRFFIEYFREPDPQLGFIINWGPKQETTAIFRSFLNISMGQILCFIMIISGILILIFTRKKYGSHKKN